MCTADVWYATVIRTPCKDRVLFIESEWRYEGWKRFHEFIDSCAAVATLASNTNDKTTTIGYWQYLFGNGLFPH